MLKTENGIRLNQPRGMSAKLAANGIWTRVRTNQSSHNSRHFWLA